MELAILLQELLKRGWKAFGEFDKLMNFGQVRGIKVFGLGELGEVEYSIRELVSKESGLWQFVCENGMVARKRGTNRCGEYCFDYKDYEYWLIESALCDEKDLEQFLIENIKI